jgi:hypothetical protein
MKGKPQTFYSHGFIGAKFQYEKNVLVEKIHVEFTKILKNQALFIFIIFPTKDKFNILCFIFKNYNIHVYYILKNITKSSQTWKAMESNRFLPILHKMKGSYFFTKNLYGNDTKKLCIENML